MSKSNIFGAAGNLITYTAVAVVLVGGLLYLTGYLKLPFLSEGFADKDIDENFEDADEKKEEKKEHKKSEGFMNFEDDEGEAKDEPKLFEDEGFVGGYAGSSSEYAAADEANGRGSVPSSDYANCYTRDGLNPSDLLPKASPEAAQFLSSNPPSAGNADSRNLLQAGFHIGVDTVCQTNKNPNLQLRSDPPISRSGPQPIFNASTIPFVQNNRRVLEMGGQTNPEGCANFRGD